MTDRANLLRLTWVGAALVAASLAVGRLEPGWTAVGGGCALLGHVALGLALVGRSELRRRAGDAARLLEVAAVTATVLLLAWVALVSPLLRAGRPAWDLLGALALVPGLALTVSADGPGRWRGRLLGGAAALLVAAAAARDVAAPTVPALGRWTEAATAVGVVLVVVGSVAVGAGAGPTRRRRPAASTGRRRVLALAALAPVGLLVLAVEHLTGRPLDVVPVVVGTLVLHALVVARAIAALDSASSEEARARELQDQLTFEATHDALTLLPNRAHGLALAQAALEEARTTGAATALLFLDLDGFKQVNDTFGHETGDQVLRRAAERLSSVVRAEDQPIRLGGDEFVVLLRDIGGADAAVRVAERLVVRISVAMQLPSGRARVGASIGVAVDLDGTTPVETLLQEADAAAYAAKAGGKGQARLYDDSMRSDAAERAQVEEIVRQALADGEMTVHYQPVVESHTGDVEGLEALVRWDRPGEGLIGPAEFLPLASSSELIGEIDAWVLREAAGQVAAWSTALGRPDLYVSVNVSRQYAARSRIVRDVDQVLTDTGIAPHQVVLEVHEATLSDEDRTVPHLQELRNRGVRVAVDDFGAGFQAVAALADLPVDVVKLDPCVLQPDPSCGDLLPLVLQGARAVGLPAVAQGVEHELQVARLRSLECASVQGFAMGRPAPASEVLASLQGGGRPAVPATALPTVPAPDAESRPVLEPVSSPTEVTSAADALPA